MVNVLREAGHYVDIIDGWRHVAKLAAVSEAESVFPDGGKFLPCNAVAGLTGTTSAFSACLLLCCFSGIAEFAMVGARYADACPLYWGRTPRAVVEEIVPGRALPLDLPFRKTLCQISFRDLVLSGI